MEEDDKIKVMSPPEAGTAQIPVHTIVMPFTPLQKCTCNDNEGCTEICDRGMTFWEVAIEEARSLPASSRGNVLDWVLLRIKELQITPKHL